MEEADSVPQLVDYIPYFAPQCWTAYRQFLHFVPAATNARSTTRMWFEKKELKIHGSKDQSDATFRDMTSSFVNRIFSFGLLHIETNSGGDPSTNAVDLFRGLFTPDYFIWDWETNPLRHVVAVYDVFEEQCTPTLLRTQIWWIRSYQVSPWLV